MNRTWITEEKIIIITLKHFYKLQINIISNTARKKIKKILTVI